MVKLVVTGFGVWQGVDANPTSTLVKALSEEACVPGDLAACQVLEVSARAVQEFFDSADTWQCDDEPILLVHFGLDGKRGVFSLERRAVNNATFRVPDERGWQPSNECIEQGACAAVSGAAAAPTPAEGGPPAWQLDSCRYSDLDLEGVAQRLRARGHADVQVSEDAGLFVCNLTLWHSLRWCAAAPNRHALFVHVPPFEVAGEAAQRTFASDLLAELCAVVGGGGGAAGEGAAAAGAQA